MSTLIHITEDGMQFLNLNRKRRVLIEKKEKTDEVKEKVLEILDRISHGNKVFSSYFEWKFRDGKNVLEIMLSKRFIGEERWTPPPIYRITPT
jgi:hypothetical protein